MKIFKDLRKEMEKLQIKPKTPLDKAAAVHKEFKPFKAFKSLLDKS